MTENTSFIVGHVALGFGEYDDRDELLHPAMNSESVDDAVTETQYFGFSVPEEKVHGFSYFWHHPNLGTISGGASAWRGIKTHHLAAEVRPELPVHMPPVAWLTGVFSDDFSFNCLLMDDPSRSPEWIGLYDVTSEQTLRGGWIRMGVKYSRIVKASMLTSHDPVHLHALSHDLEVVDEHGARFELYGEIVSSCPSGFWPAAAIKIGLVKWQCNGLTGWGDSQESQWTDFVHAMHARR